MMTKNNFQKVISILGVLVLAATCGALGFWQLNRARESRLPRVVNPTVTHLDSVTKPKIALPAAAVFRNVQVSGRYVSEFEAPMQVDGNGKVGTWQVGLLETESGSAILVVRGLWADRNQYKENPADTVEVIGQLLPHQNDDVAQNQTGVLSRIDSALVANQTNLGLYDGYIVAERELRGDVEALRTRIVPPKPQSAVPGFYWQHLSYVFIWWFMAGLVLYLPFYQRRVASKVEQEMKEK